MSVSRHNAIINEQLFLNGFFTTDNDNQYFDPFEITKVEILDSDLTTVLETISPPNIIRDTLGKYHVITSSGWNTTARTVYDQYHYRLVDGGTLLQGKNPCVIRSGGGVGVGDCRLGFAFDNPDTVSNNGFGRIITADELRYMYAFGTDLVAQNAQTIVDATLNWYVDEAIGHVQRDFNVQLQKRIFKHRPLYGQSRDDLGGMGDEGIDYFFEDPYDFDRKTYKSWIYTKLRRRPIISVEKVELRDVAGNLAIDITQWVKVNHEKGSLQFFPTMGSLESLPVYLGQTFAFETFFAGVSTYPDAFFIDYTAGFETAEKMKKRWNEMFGVVGKLAAINLLADFGDGRSAAIGSSSIGLSGISESFSTTMSATSAMYGARIIQFTKELKDFYKMNKNKYAGFQFIAV